MKNSIGAYFSTAEFIKAFCIAILLSVFILVEILGNLWAQFFSPFFSIAGLYFLLIANKIYGVYAAVCQDPFCAGLARSHSNTNVLCLGGKIIGSAIAQEIVKTWMTTDYLINEKRYTSRVDKVIEIAEKHIRKDI